MFENLLNNLPGIRILVMVFVALALADFLFGVLAAYKCKKVKSRIMREGILDTVAELILLSLGAFVSHLIPDISKIVGIVIFLFIVKELHSIAENWKRLGKWLPKFLDKGLDTAIDVMDSITIESNKREDVHVKIKK